MNEICNYDEGYDRRDAYELGWCYECKCGKNCPGKRIAEQEKKNRKEY